jgi:UDP-N-acetylglucosamine 2-epimerase (non-hydrolysing)
LDDPVAHAAMAKSANPYGDGHTAERIINALTAASPKFDKLTP